MLGLTFWGSLTKDEPKISEPQFSQEVKVESKQMDRNAQILADYLGQHNSPLQYHAQDLIDAANLYELDWRLVPAIAGVESTFGKKIPGGYNAWGWGVYGNRAIYFKSWKDGIYTLSQGLREKYINRGLTDPYLMNRIYAKSPAWGWKVNYFMADLQEFAQTYEQETEPINVSLSPSEIAVVSASPVLR